MNETVAFIVSPMAKTIPLHLRLTETLSLCSRVDRSFFVFMRHGMNPAGKDISKRSYWQCRNCYFNINDRDFPTMSGRSPACLNAEVTPTVTLTSECFDTQA